jgi:hypothetical protein
LADPAAFQALAAPRSSKDLQFWPNDAVFAGPAVVGFVMRGPKSVVGMTPDFIQHIVNELLWKSFLRDWLISKYGKSAFLVSAVEHLSLMLPSSDTRYALMGGMKLDLGTAQITAAFTWGCKAVDSERLTIDERIVPIPEGWSLGVGFQKRF